jgi:hypothetical protein
MGMEKGEKHDRLCWPNDLSPVAGPRTSGVGSFLTAHPAEVCHYAARLPPQAAGCARG